MTDVSHIGYILVVNLFEAPINTFQMQAKYENRKTFEKINEGRWNRPTKWKKYFKIISTCREVTSIY